MAVAVVNAAHGREGAATTSHSFSFDPGTCNALYIGVYHDDDVNNTFSSVQFNGAAMTLVSEIPAGNERLHVWRIMNPVSGAQNFTCTTSGSNRLLYSCVSLSGVDTTTPNGTVVTNSASTAVDRTTTSVTCPTDGLVLGIYREVYSDANPTTSGTFCGTPGYHRDANGRVISAATRTTTGAITWTSSNYAFAWDAMGIPINAAAVGGFAIPLMGQQCL